MNCLNLTDKNVIVRMHNDTLENGSKGNCCSVLALQPTYMDMHEQHKQLNETSNIWQGHCVLIKYWIDILSEKWKMSTQNAFLVDVLITT